MKDALENNKALILVFFACFAYWIYLLFLSSMSITCDAIGYERLGRMIYEQGWTEFFRTGPNREPLYPFSIAISMWLADICHVSYQKVQTVSQILILFAVQILALKIMTMCSFREWIKASAVLYLGFSPAIVNAGFSLFSEILAMPFVLLIVVFAAQSWEKARTGEDKYILLPAVGLSFAFVGAIGVKAIFQYIFYLFAITFFTGAIVAIWRNQRDVAQKIIVGTLMMFLLVGGSVNGYKYLNEIYNGKFDITDRYDYFLFGTAYKRVQPLSKDVWLAHFASIPGNNFCESIVNETACRYPQFYGSDDIWPAVLPPMLEGVPEKEISSKTIQLSFREIKNNPIQYFFLTFLESLKMGFWESTQIGFVDYPEFLSRIFQNQLFKNGIRFASTLLTYAAFFWAILLLSRLRRKSAEGDIVVNSAHILFCILFIIVTFAGLYSFFPILSRYALPIAPLYVICIAFLFNTVISRNAHWRVAHVQK